MLIYVRESCQWNSFLPFNIFALFSKLSWETRRTSLVERFVAFLFASTGTSWHFYHTWNRYFALYLLCERPTYLEWRYLMLKPRKTQVSTMPIAEMTAMARKRLMEITRGTTTSKIESGGGCPSATGCEMTFSRDGCFFFCFSKWTQKLQNG